MSWTPEVRIDRCVCQRTLFVDLLDEARRKAWSLEDLRAETGCGDQCGICLPYLRSMLVNGITVFTTVLEPDEEAL